MSLKMTVLVIGAFLVPRSNAQTPSHPDHMEHHFDPAASAKAFDDPARDAWQMPDRVIAMLGLKPGQIVTDIGSGTGYFSVRLAKPALGLPEPRMLQPLRGAPRVQAPVRSLTPISRTATNAAARYFEQVSLC